MADTLVKKEEQREEVAPAERVRSGQTYSPRIDIWENQEELTLYADLPGVAADQLEIRYENGELTIYGRVEPRQADVTFLYGEYGIGDFYRTFAVGEAVDSEKIAAELHNGVLTLHLPKTEAVKPRRIEVQTR